MIQLIKQTALQQKQIIKSPKKNNPFDQTTLKKQRHSNFPSQIGQKTENIEMKQQPQHSKTHSFTLQNLQPINYLKTFNKMLQYMGKPSTQLPDTSKELKTVRLSKFPLHSYYEQMEGIVQGSSKKQNQSQKVNKKDAEQEKLEEKFINKHYTFVKGALQKIIQDNESQQTLLMKSKNFYQTHQSRRNGPQYEQQILGMVKLRSQPKLRSIKNTIDSARKTVRQSLSKNSNFNSARTLGNSYTRNHAKHDSQKSIENNKKQKRKFTMNHDNTNTVKTEHSSLQKDDSKGNNKLSSQNEQQNNEQERNPIFKKLKPPQKIQKFNKRRFQEIDLLLNARKTFLQKKKKSSIEKIHPLTERIHMSQDFTQTKKASQYLKHHPKLSESEEPRHQSFKLKLRQKYQSSLQLDENEEEKFSRELAVEQFKKEIGTSCLRKRKSYLQVDESLIDEFEDQDDRFFKEVEHLQNQQMKSQQDFASVVEEKIKAVKEKLNKKIQQVKKFEYSVPN